MIKLPKTLFFLLITFFSFAQEPPVANDDDTNTFINTVLNEVSPGLLDNDTDADGDVLTITEFLVNGTTYIADQTAVFSEGTIIISQDGSYNFTPNLNYLGAVSLINYTITDGTFRRSANLSISVLLPPEPPVAINDDAITYINTSIIEVSPGLLGNDTDADGDVLSITEFLVNGTTYIANQTAVFSEGTIIISQDGSYNFTPNLNYLGAVSLINYTITDGTFIRDANLSISVLLPPEPPVANNDDAITFINTSIIEVSPGLLGNDTDPDGDVLIITEFLINGTKYNVGQTAVFSEGTIIISQDGSYNFTPKANYLGAVSLINYTITDGTFIRDANLSISVFLPPEPPIANDDYDTADINTTLNVTAPGVFINDTDINEEDTLLVNQFNVNGITYNAGDTAIFAEGSIVIASDGSYIFVPLLNYTGNVSLISYTIFDGTFTSTANLFLTVEPIDDLLEISNLNSCNQGFTANGEYKIRYNLSLRNKSQARDYHEPSLIKNIDLIKNLQSTFGVGCVISVTQINIDTSSDTIDYVNNSFYPEEFDNTALNDSFINSSSTSILNTNAINNLILYPRQSIFITFCVTIKPFCNGRPNPTPSGSGIDFNNVINVSSSSGITSSEFTLKDFHTAETVVSAGLYVPEFNNSINSPGIINSDGTFDYTNTVIITNEGSTTANNINYNMGLGDFIDKGITFNQLVISKVSGPDVNINLNYNGITDSFLLMPNNSLASGETLILEVFYLISPFSSQSYSYFYQSNRTQTQGGLDGSDETTLRNKRRFSFVTWSDNLGNHLDRYYRLNSPTQIPSSSSQCSCSTLGMRFLYTYSSSTNKIISDTKTAPNGILEHEEITFQVTIRNTSESVQIQNLQLQDDLTSNCGSNIIYLSKPFIQNSTATVNPDLNPSFNGISDINIFNGSSGILKVDEIITIQFSVVFNETCKGVNTSFFSSVDPLGVSLNSSSSVSVNAFTDTDKDGVLNEVDIDDDNDTILDVLEYNGLNPLQDDDLDFIPNYRDIDYGVDANGDGIVDVFDFDNDGVPNHFDLDSDNDGILDIEEVSNIALDTNNGITANAVGANGFDNTLENNDTVNAEITYTILNTDLNGNPNYLDIDADGDGIVDNIEAQSTDNYISLNGSVSLTGINTAYPNGILPVDTENDGISDYIDTNSDNDIRDDYIEGWDINSDGIPETIAFNSDIDNDGLDDAFDTNNNLVNPTNGLIPTDFPNADNIDTIERDWREIIAIFVIIDNVSKIESEDFVFTITLVTKNNNSILIESASPIDINFSTINGTPDTDLYDVATSPFDFTGFTNTIFTIAPFTNKAKFTVISIEDTIYELVEFFTLNAVITSNNTLNAELNALGSILDNDAAPSITMNNSREDEGIDLTHTITLSNPSSTPILIDVKTNDNLATSPDDYMSILENLTIEGTIDPINANTDVSFTINSFLDNLNELEEETLNVIGVVTTSNTSNQDLIKTATILDIDPSPFVEINDLEVVEGNPLEFEIRLLNTNLEPMRNYLPINFVLETIDDTTSGNEDYKSISIATNIPALTFSKTQTIITLDDRLNEETETLFLQANVNTQNVSNTFASRGIGIIKDNDYPNLFSPNFDGKSDFFKISGIEEYPNFKLVIFNRLGNEVYNYSNNGNTNPLWWDGSHKGKPVPVGVYYYTLDFNDGITKPQTNFIQLIR